MNVPPPYSTLTQAAKWMTETTGTEWTSDSLLYFIFRKMLAATLQEFDEAEEEQRAAFHPVSCLYISLPPTTRVVYRCYDDTLTIKTTKYERGETPPMTLENYKHVHALIKNGAIALPFPLTSEPWNGVEGYWIEADTAPIITPESLRIACHDLCELADTVNEQNKQKTALANISLELPAATAAVVPVNGGLSQDSSLVAETNGLEQNPAIALYSEAERAFGRNLWMDKVSQLAHEQDILERFKLGRYTLAVAAVELAKKTGWDANRWLFMIKQAIESEKLSLKNPEDYTDNLPYAVPEKLRDYRDQVSAAEVNAWLATHTKWGVTARLDYESMDKLTPQSVPAFPAANAPVLSTQNKLKNRIYPLDAEITKARKMAIDKDDVSSIWAELVKLAEAEAGCLRMVIGGVIKYQSGEEIKLFNKKALAGRISRKKKKEKAR